MMNNLRGIFGSVGRALMGRQEQEPAAPQTGGYRGMGPGMDGAPLPTPKTASMVSKPATGQGRFPMGQFLLGGYEAVDRRRQYEAAQAKAERMEQLRTMAEPLFAQNPSARVLFEADPERFASLLEESLKPYTMTGGQVRRGGFGAPVSQSKVEQFGDVYANVDPMSGRVTYSDPRPQTYSERETARSNRADEALGQGRLGVSQAQLALEREKHKARQAAGGYGAPGVGGVIGPELDPSEWDIVQ